MSQPPRAAAFIVTIYGDVVEPRGGVLWMGNLIQICAMVGLSESVVRTAVSRLVAAGQLVGERAGRRSFYRLTEVAQTEYDAAARLIYAGEPQGESWRIVLSSERPEGRAYRHLGGDVWLGPDRGEMPRGTVFRGDVMAQVGIAARASVLWDLPDVAETYRGVVDSWTGAAPPASEAYALAQRLTLVHAFRMIVLRDPRLPRQALPLDWPEAAARRCFAEVYLSLAASADAWISDTCLAMDGPLPKETEATRARYACLRDTSG